MGGRGEIVAVERHAGRARALHNTALRMGAANVTVLDADVAGRDLRPRPAGESPMGACSLDAPCSGLGRSNRAPTCAGAPRATAVQSLAEEQARLLSAAAAACGPGATLVYSTCTISAAENEHQIGAFLDAHPEFAAIDLQARYPRWAHPHARAQLLALGHVQGSDGFFVAALARES